MGRLPARLGFLHRDQLFIMSFPIHKTEQEWQAELQARAPSPPPSR